MEKQVIFKKATVGGFDKKEVLSYIDELDQKFNESKQQLEEQLAVLKKENNRLTEEVNRAKQKEEESAAKLEEQQNKNKELSSLTDALNFEIRKQKYAMEEKDREIQIQTERGNQLQQKVDELQQKNQKYDDASMQIGTLLLDADKMAKDIVGKAEDKAREMDADMARKSADVQEKFSAFKNELASLKMCLNDSVQAFQSELDELEGLAAQTEKWLSGVSESEQEGAEEPSAEEAAAQETVSPEETVLSDRFFR